jgi:hypothetical protein
MSTATAEQPVVRRGVKRKSELDSRSVTPEQKPSLKMAPINEPQERPSTIVPADPNMKDLDFDALAFSEDPIRILIHRSIDPKFSPNCTDYIAVNGVAAEMLFKNGWIKLGYLPRGIPFYTKRKYVEVIAKSKMTQWSTRVEEKVNEDPMNYTDPVTSATLAFSVLEDKNPKGAEWLVTLLRQES